ncbi:MAG: asparagine synthase (glutamine-hydrolyzing) [Crocinitomicaceae bacterium]|nr:asparagine synthase (glutamine-hydrolyzing) [Crocinitomicaceae bacterium]|tara:strand:- start:6268 stop:8127 length:1860 start_codon:yes stop_codon:yes gene_type:complete
MCGIAGIVDFKKSIEITPELIEEISSPNRYRGPDNYGVHIDSSTDFTLGFGHNRLSIIDLSEKASQPMVSKNGRYIISFNGEIYNFKELRKKLIHEGAKFFSKSDTEVILNAVDFWGIDHCLDNIEGMFAFAIFDREKKKLIIARDRFGEKPLYYFKSDKFISFSSDIRSFNFLPIKKTINNYALGYYFSEMSTPINHSIWNEIEKVPPANYITITKDECTIKKYWLLDYRQKLNLNSDEVIKNVNFLISNSVGKQLTSDVEVGCLLSGGIDSTLISFHASKLYDKKIKTFSVGFKDQKFNELPYAKVVSEKINSDHHEIIMDLKSLDTVRILLEEYGEPFADVSSIPTFFITKFAANYVKVILGGDGGDELFAGYNTYHQAFRMQQWKNFKISHTVIKILYHFFSFAKFKYLQGVITENNSTLGSSLFRNIGFNKNEIYRLTNNSDISIMMDAEHSKLIKESKNFTNNIFDTILYSSIKSRLVNDYLVKSDRASMLNSIELRSPFLDRELHELVSKLDYKLLFSNKERKFVTKKILNQHFSKKFIKRKKQGFEMPIAEFIRNNWKKDIKEVLHSKNHLIYLNENYIKNLLENHFNKKQDNSKKIWNLYVLNLWSLKQK